MIDINIPFHIFTYMFFETDLVSGYLGYNKRRLCKFEVDSTRNGNILLVHPFDFYVIKALGIASPVYSLISSQNVTTRHVTVDIESTSVNDVEPGIFDVIGRYKTMILVTRNRGGRKFFVKLGVRDNARLVQFCACYYGRCVPCLLTDGVVSNNTISIKLPYEHMVAPIGLTLPTAEVVMYTKHTKKPLEKGSMHFVSTFYNGQETKAAIVYAQDEPLFIIVRNPVTMVYKVTLDQLKFLEKLYTTSQNRKSLNYDLNFMKQLVCFGTCISTTKLMLQIRYGGVEPYSVPLFMINRPFDMVQTTYLYKDVYASAIVDNTNVLCSSTAFTNSPVFPLFFLKINAVTTRYNIRECLPHLQHNAIVYPFPFFRLTLRTPINVRSMLVKVNKT